MYLGDRRNDVKYVYIEKERERKKRKQEKKKETESKTTTIEWRVHVIPVHTHVCLPADDYRVESACHTRAHACLPADDYRVESACHAGRHACLPACRIYPCTRLDVVFGTFELRFRTP